MTGKRGRDREEVVRQAFRRSAEGVEPDVSRLVDAVPAMLAEARRRRALAARAGTIAAVVPLARRVIPAMAAAAAALVLVATFVGFRGTSATVDGTTDVDRLLLTGEVGGNVSDVLLDAMTEGENDDG